MSRVTYGQKGYDGCSMSLRAREAYDGGEMPRSKWTKTAMIAAIREACEDESRAYDPAIEKRTAADLFKTFFWCSSVHHTGKFARETEFYEVDRYAINDEFAFEFHPDETRVQASYFVRTDRVLKVAEGRTELAAVRDVCGPTTTAVYADERTATCRALDALMNAERVASETGAAGVIVTYGECACPCSRGVFDVGKMKYAASLWNPHVWTALPGMSFLPGTSWGRERLAGVCATGVLSLDDGAHYRQPDQLSRVELHRLLDYMCASGDFLAAHLMAHNGGDIRAVFDVMCRFALKTPFRLGRRGRFDARLGHTFDLTGEGRGITFDGRLHWRRLADVRDGDISENWATVEKSLDPDLRARIRGGADFPDTPEGRRAFLAAYLDRAGELDVYETF